MTPNLARTEAAPDIRGAGRTRLLVDWTRCDGRGLCAELLPDLVGRDDWGFPIIDDRPLRSGELGYAKRAVGACPVLALRLETG